jgi:hypothetical protein
MLPLFLGIIVVVIIFANYLSQEAAMMTSNLINLIITIPLIVFAVLLVLRHGIMGNFGKAWIFFAASMILWFVAERIWTVYELIYKTDVWPSEADYFWFAGYPAYYLFSFFYIRSFRNVISKKTIGLAVGAPITILAFSLYYTFDQISGLSFFEKLFGLGYPVFDSISLVPIIIGLALFSRGKVSFLWLLLLLGILSFVVSDLSFLVLSIDEQYYTGHPVDIPYLWGYLFFLFGIHSYWCIFKKRSQENHFYNSEDFR